MPGFGALAHPWWVPVLYVLVLGHVTNLCVTLYLHRGATHGGVRYHPAMEHFMRFWLWLTTGMRTREWVAVHRKHHSYSDREGDPHSPAEEGLWAIVLGGVFFYRRAATDRELLEKYGRGCPDDWVERNVYTPHNFAGIMVMALVDVVLFGPAIGLLVWSVSAIWMPIMGNIINGLGHAVGYRNFSTKDHSRNIYPLGIWIVGEELHNNHHADPRSAKFKANWWEFDIGWVYLQVLSFLGLAEIVYARKVSARQFAAAHYPEPSPLPARLEAAIQTLEQATGDLGALVSRMREDARVRIGEARADAAEELTEALGRLEQKRERARQAFEHARSEARTDLEEARTRLEEARRKAVAVVEQARQQAEALAARMETGGGAGARA